MRYTHKQKSAILQKIIDKISKEILYLICDYPHKHYTFKHFEA